MGSPSSSAKHTPADADHRPAGKGAELEVASSLLPACSALIPATKNKILQQPTFYHWLQFPLAQI